MQTFFIRHSAGLDVSDETREQLWAKRWIAIHYPHDKSGSLTDRDNQSIDPEDYPGRARTAMTIFSSLASAGGYVCAQYLGKPELLVGKIQPQSRITVFKGQWGSASRPAFLKILQLTGTRTVNPRESTIIEASRPRQGTLARWNAVGDTIAALIEGRAQPISWDLLSSAQQEIGCSEFLRLPQTARYGLPRLQSLLLPVGRTLKDIDFVGIAEDGKQIFAQVTYSQLHNIGWKIDKLRKFVTDKKSHVILFCNCEKQELRDGIHFFPVQEVFRVLNNLKWGQCFLRGTCAS